MSRFRCSQCAFEKQVSEDLIGQKARCPKCKAVSLISDDPIVPVVVEIEDDEPEDFWMHLPSDDEPVDSSAEDSFSEELPPLGKKRRSVKGGPGIPKPRSFMTTALLAGGTFGIGMGLFTVFQHGTSGAGLIAALLGGPLFGILIACVLSGRQIAVQFESREDFIKLMKRAFKKIKHEPVDLSDPLFVFKHEQGAAFFVSTHVHVGKREAILVGPRTYVKQFGRQLAEQFEVNWSGKKLKESHGEAPPDTVAVYAWIAAAIVLFVMVNAFKEMSSPEGKAKSYVRSRLKAPSEAKFISSKVIGRDAGGTRVEVVFEAPNSFGAKLRDSMTVLIKSDGTVGEL